MSKRKKEEPGGGSFKNTPFRELKKIVPKEAPAAPVKARTSAPAAIRQEGNDEDLFRRAVAGARPVVREDEDGEGPAAHAPRTEAPREHTDADALSGDQFLQAMQSLGTATLRPGPEDDDDEAAGERRSVSGRMRQLKKGVLRISGEIDLHGFLREEALRRLEHFIASASARGQQAVLVITGKGNNSAEGPVLPGAVAEWLRSAGASQVAEFHPAPRDKGGSGAYVVFLRKK